MSATPHRRAVSSPVIAYVGDEYPARTAGEGELRHEVADRAGSGNHHIFAREVSCARGGVRPYGGGSIIAPYSSEKVSGSLTSRSSGTMK